MVGSSTSATATIQVRGTAPTYGADATTDVVVRLEVTDCYGATSSPDPVTLSYTCTGL